MNMHHAETIDEAINDIEIFFESDMWYAKKEEWKTENDMIKYLRGHFNILRREIKQAKRKETLKKNKKEKPYIKGKKAIKRLRDTK